MAATTRVFVAIPLPPKQIERLSQLQTRLAGHVGNVRWVEPESLHLTLAFLGDVRDSELNDLCKTVQGCCRETPAFELELEKIGVFPNPEAPRTYWAGLAGSEEAMAELSKLHRSLTEALSRAGWPPVDHRFAPHITIGRARQDRGKRGKDRDRDPDDAAPATENASEAIRAFSRWKGGPFAAAQVQVYSSILQPEGPLYNILSRTPLKGAPRR